MLFFCCNQIFFTFYVVCKLKLLLYTIQKSEPTWKSRVQKILNNEMLWHYKWRINIGVSALAYMSSSICDINHVSICTNGQKFLWSSCSLSAAVNKAEEWQTKYFLKTKKCLKILFWKSRHLSLKLVCCCFLKKKKKSIQLFTQNDVIKYTEFLLVVSRLNHVL